MFAYIYSNLYVHIIMFVFVSQMHAHRHICVHIGATSSNSGKLGLPYTDARLCGNRKDIIMNTFWI